MPPNGPGPVYYALHDRDRIPGMIRNGAGGNKRLVSIVFGLNCHLDWGGEAEEAGGGGARGGGGVCAGPGMLTDSSPVGFLLLLVAYCLCPLSLISNSFL
jgi:hypothetical protein